MSDSTERTTYRQAKAIDRYVSSTLGTTPKITSFANFRSQAKGIVTGRRGPMSGKSKALIKKTKNTSGTSRLSMKGRKTTVAARKRRVNRV